VRPARRAGSSRCRSGAGGRRRSIGWSSRSRRGTGPVTGRPNSSARSNGGFASLPLWHRFEGDGSLGGAVAPYAVTPRGGPIGVLCRTSDGSATSTRGSSTVGRQEVFKLGFLQSPQGIDGSRSQSTKVLRRHHDECASGPASVAWQDCARAALISDPGTRSEPTDGGPEARAPSG
jgi:hypothetical protein